VLDGFARLLGHDAISYATAGFPEALTPGRFVAFHLADDPAARAFVALHDHAEPNPLALEWARVVGMVNVRPADVRGAIVPVGPTFGVRLVPRRLTLRHVWHATRFAGLRATPGVVRGAARHVRLRVPSDAYTPGPSDPDYAFFTAWPWALHPEVNPPRVAFVEAARRSPGLEVEGGFAPRRRADLPELLPYTAEHRYPMRTYLRNTARSVVAFNNPAVHGCLGWKLGEHLALGKAIITLPLGRALPAPLEHGEHVHVVDGTPESLDDAIGRLRGDHAYRRQLERAARDWYDTWLEPTRLAQRLLDLLRS
jgi:hypothetical protein